MATKNNVGINLNFTVDGKKAEQDLKKIADLANKVPGVKKVNVKVKDIDKATKEINGMNGALSKQQTIFSTLNKLAGRYFSIYAAANLGKKIAETTGYFQQQQVALEGILQSASQARSVLSDIKDFALKSPFQTKELVTFTKQLAAFGIKGNDLFPTVTKLADISAGLGVDMSRIILAYGQVRSAAVLRGQELRQFTEAGIPLVDELAKKFSALNGTLVTTGEVFRLISERKVSFEMVASVLSDMTAEGGRFYKMQENITDTMYGQIQKLKDMWTLEMDRMGKGSYPFFMGIIKGMQGAIKYGKELAVSIGAAFASAKIAKFLTHIQAYMRMMRIAIATTGGLGAAISAVAGVAAGLFVGLYSRANRLGKEMDEIASTVDKDTKRMIDGLESLTQKITKANYGTKEYNEAVSTLAQNYSSFIGRDVIEKLQGEENAAKATASAFQELAETVKDAIKSYNEFQKLEQQKKAAQEEYSTEAKSEEKKFINWIRNNGYATGDELKNDYRERYGRDASDKDIRKKLRELYSASVSEFATGDIMTKEEFGRILRESIKNQFPSIKSSELENIVATGIHAAFNSNVGLGLAGKSFQAILDKQRDIEASEFYRMNHYFDSVKKGEILDTGDAIGYAYNVEANYVKALHDTLIDKFGANGLSKELDDALKSAYQVVNDGKVIADKFDANTIHNIEQLFEDFRQTFSGNAGMMKWLEQVRTTFTNNVNSSTGRTAAVRNKIEGNSFYRFFAGDEATRSLWARYNPTDATYNTLRAGLKGEYDAKKGELDTYLRKNEAKDLPAINSLKQQIAALELLASADYFNVDLTSKTRRGGRGRTENWRRFFTDLFSYIKEAKAEEKKLVDFSAGTTKALEEQIKSGQLKGTAVQAFWGEGSPFQEIIKKMGEYGIESKVFSPEFLNDELGKIVTKSLESTGTIDFADVWEQLIQVLQKRSNEIQDKTLKQQINDYLAGKVSEGERLSSRDKVEGLIKDQLAQITRINANVEKIRSERDMFERIAKSSNYLTAQSAIYGGGQYSRFDSIGTTAGALLGLLGQDVGRGINYAVPGLKRLLEGGNLSISSLGELLGIREQLRNATAAKTAADMEGATDAERSANFERFKGVLNQFDDLIKKLANDIAEEFEKLMALRGPAWKASDTIIEAGRQYLDDISLIRKEEENGGRTSGMRIQAIQRFYSATAKSLGGTGMPDYINQLFPGLGAAGLNTPGFKLGMWLGGGSLAERAANYQASSIKAFDKTREDFETEEAYNEALKQYTEEIEKATKPLMDFAAKMQLAGAIISKVDSYIQKSAQFANDLISAMDANNGLVKDEYGNYTYENDYSTAKDAIKTITDLSSGISGAFQSLLSGDIFGALMGIGSTIAKFFENLFGIGDSQIQKQQDRILSSNKSLERALDKLRNQINEVAGMDKWDNLTEQIEQLRQVEENNIRLEQMEVSKKHGDIEKAESFREASEQAAQEVRDIIRGIREEIFGTADEIASQLADPLVEAFRNGQNAAREWRDAVRGYIADVLKDTLMTKVIAPRIQSILDRFGIGENNTDANSIISLMSDPNKMVGLRNDLFAVGDWAVDWFNNLAPAIQELMAWNNNTSELSGGIQGITEDTARTLEGLANSMLSQLILIQRSMTYLETSGFANVQTSWFNDMLTQQRAIRQATDSINSILGDSSNGVRSLQVRIA